MNSSDKTVMYNARAILVLYVLCSLKVSGTDAVSQIIREMTYAKKDQRRRANLDKIVRGM